MTEEYYHRRYTRRQPKPLAYLTAGFVLGAAVVNFVILLLGAPPCSGLAPMACVGYTTPPPVPDYRPDRDFILPASYQPPTREPFLVCQTGGVQ